MCKRFCRTINYSIAGQDVSGFFAIVVAIAVSVFYLHSTVHRELISTGIKICPILIHTTICRYHSKTSTSFGINLVGFGISHGVFDGNIHHGVSEHFIHVARQSTVIFVNNCSVGFFILYFESEIHLVVVFVVSIEGIWLLIVSKWCKEIHILKRSRMHKFAIPPPYRCRCTSNAIENRNRWHLNMV